MIGIVYQGARRIIILKDPIFRKKGMEVLAKYFKELLFLVWMANTSL